ncbi:MAG: NuoM family protein [Deinococcales bacterium]
MSNVLHVFIFLPLLAALVSLAVPKAARGKFAVFVGIINLAIGVYIWLGTDLKTMTFVTDWLPELGIKYAVALDGVSLLLSLVTCIMVPLGLYYLTTRDDGKLNAFYPLALAMQTGILGIYAARDLILFYVFFEGTLIPSLFLLGRYGRAKRIQALTTMALYTVFGGLLMLVSIIALRLMTGSPSFLLEDIVRGLRLPMADVNVFGLTIHPKVFMLLGFLLALAVKTPLFPMHAWLPEFHAQNHPSGVADLMGTLYKVGGYALFRFVTPMFGSEIQAAQGWLMGLAAFTALYGAWIAFAQTDFKRLLAYAGISHMGLVALGVFSLHPAGISGAMLLLAFQGIYSSALFLVVGMLERRFIAFEGGLEGKEKALDHALEIGRVRGLAASAPAFAGVALLLWFASIGVPGLAGFIGEYSILLGAYQANPWAAALALTTVVASAAFALYAYQRTWYEVPSHHVADLGNKEWRVLVPVVALVVILGVYSTPALELVKPVVAQQFGIISEAQK